MIISHGLDVMKKSQPIKGINMKTSEIKNTITELLLQINPELKEINPKLSFNEIGINSIDRMDLISMVGEEFSIKLTVQDYTHINSLEQLEKFFSKKLSNY